MFAAGPEMIRQGVVTSTLLAGDPNSAIAHFNHFDSPKQGVECGGNPRWESSLYNSAGRRTARMDQCTTLRYGVGGTNGRLISDEDELSASWAFVGRYVTGVCQDPLTTIRAPRKGTNTSKGYFSLNFPLG